MLKKHMAACLVASAFMTMPVLAQTSTSPGATQPATGASSGTGGSGASAGSSAASGRFITQQQQNQWRASRLIGVDVYGSDNEKIGDINEVLVDRSGNADAVVLGVGGFLGIGEKNVALPFNAFEWQMEDNRRTASASGTGSGAGGSGSAARSGDTAATGSTASTSPGASGSTAGRDTAGTTASTSAAGSGTRSGSERGYPDHAVLRMTKADLEKAPAFRYVGERASDDRSGSAGRTSGSGAGGTGTGAGSPGTAPRQ
jgi:PRC-barrel domain